MARQLHPNGAFLNFLHFSGCPALLSAPLALNIILLALKWDPPLSLGNIGTYDSGGPSGHFCPRGFTSFRSCVFIDFLSGSGLIMDRFKGRKSGIPENHGLSSFSYFSERLRGRQ